MAERLVNMAIALLPYIHTASSQWVAPGSFGLEA